MEQLLIEKVWNFTEGGGRLAIPIPYACDLHLSDESLSVTVRPEWEKHAPKELKGLSVTFGQVQKVSAEKHNQPIPVKDGDPLICSLDTEYSKGSHFWDKRVVHFGLTAAQYSTLRAFMLNRLALAGRVFLPPTENEPS